MGKLFSEFMLREGFRQDALIHGTASQLGTKNGLFMVFAAFVFTAESTLVSSGTVLGVRPPQWALEAPLLLSLVGIACLVRAALLHEYKLPPILPKLGEQSGLFFNLPDICDLPEEQQMQRFEGKFVKSLMRAIDNNHSLNNQIADILEKASWLIGGSVAWLFVLLSWPIGISLYRAFRHLLS